MVAQNYDTFQNDHLRMFDLIKKDMSTTSYLTGIKNISPNVEHAFRGVSRHYFVTDALKDFAYLNQLFSIVQGQAISQPFIVALMTELLQSKEEYKVLEIGTSLGYQAAILAELAREVYTIVMLSFA